MGRVIARLEELSRWSPGYEVGGQVRKAKLKTRRMAVTATQVADQVKRLAASVEETRALRREMQSRRQVVSSRRVAGEARAIAEMIRVAIRQTPFNRTRMLRLAEKIERGELAD